MMQRQLEQMPRSERREHLGRPRSEANRLVVTPGCVVVKPRFLQLGERGPIEIQPMHPDTADRGAGGPTHGLQLSSTPLAVAPGIDPVHGDLRSAHGQCT